MSEGPRAAQSLPPFPSAAAAPLEQARLLYARGQWVEPEAQCRAVLQRQPGHPAALGLLGILLAQTRRMPEAAELLGRAAAAMPDSADAHPNHGNALRALGRHHEALACYERSLALKPDSAEAHYNRGGPRRPYPRCPAGHRGAARRPRPGQLPGVPGHPGRPAR